MNILNRRCPLCGEHGFKPFGINLIKCRSCRMVVDPIIGDEKRIQVLNDEWFEDSGEEDTSNWVRLFEKRNNSKTLGRLKGFIKQGEKKSLLEVGVGSGSLLRFMKKNGFNVTGCDLSSSVCRRMESNHRIPMVNGHPSEIEPDSQFDVVIMNHVLEHVSEPVSFLRAVRSKLTPGGVMHIATPNVGAWEAHLRGWTGFQPYHLLYFTPDVLLKTLKESGFKIVSTKTNEPFSGWFLSLLRTILIRAREENGNPAPSSPGGGRNRLVENAYRFSMVTAGLLSLPLRRIQAQMGYGEEIVVLAVKGEKN